VSLSSENFPAMPSKRGKSSTGKSDSRISDDAESLLPIDVQYNPKIVDGLLYELMQQVDIKCTQLQKDSDFMTMSIQQAFHLELIKLPTQVKNMSLARFKAEFGDSLEAVTRSAIGGLANKSVAMKSNTSTFGSAVKSSRPNTKVFQTPSGGQKGQFNNMSTVMRNPREGEKILSSNGSPLGDFRTVVKASKPGGGGVIPATPGVFIPLDSGDVIELSNIDINSLSKDHKDDALAKMQAMMASIQNCIVKIEKSK
jgi:Nbl1 / Borealin N terminal/Cell division cycle-associated protein 8